MHKKATKNKGFTLIEIIVAISIFTIILFISTGSILSVLDANRKSQNLRSVMDNLNYTLEAVTRTIRFGENYHCDITSGSISVPSDCASGASSISVTNSSGSQVIYRLTGSVIERSTNGGATYSPLTSSNVTITRLTFWVLGSAPYAGGVDVLQPRVIMVISGYVGAKPTSRSTFTLQTTISQRVIDSV